MPLSTSAVAAPPNSTYAEAVLADRPLGYWRFEEQDVGSSAADSAEVNKPVNGRCKSVTPGVPSATPALGRAVLLRDAKGSPGWIAMGTYPGQLLNADMTMEWWQYDDGTDETFIIYRWSSPEVHDDEWILRDMWLTTSTPEDLGKETRTKWCLNDDPDGYEDVLHKAPTLSHTGRWYHVAIVRNAEQRLVRFYINGQPVGKPLTCKVRHDHPGFDKPATLTLGHADGPGLTGRIDEVAFYDKALDSERILAHYRAALDLEKEEPMSKIVAHRGNHRYAPENTAVSYEQAIDAGASIVEIDLNRTRDDVLILMHDDTLDRTTNGTGKVMNHTLDQIKQLDAGSWKHERYTGERVPTFREITQICKDRAVMMLDLKIKLRGDEIAAVLQDAAIEPDQVIIAPWEVDQAGQIKPYLPDATIILLHSKLPDGHTEGDAFFTRLKSMGFSGFSLSWRNLTKPFVDAAHRHGMQVHTWTLNNPEDISGAVLMGVDGIITDIPAEASALLAELRSE